MNRHLLIIAVFFLSCGNPTRPPPVSPTVEAPKAPPAPPVQEAAIGVKMRVLASTSANPDPHEIISGGELRSGDRVALTLSVVDQPAYIYVIQASSDGKAARLYPEFGDVQVSPDNLVRIPREGRWFKLDQHSGQENFFVYAAKQAISPAVLEAHMKSDAATVKAPAQARPAGSRQPRVAAPERSGADAGAPGPMTRELVLVDNLSSGSPDPDGIIRRRFTIQHHR